jgi:RNA polymerase sigma-70 factor (ECF subfamily)
VATNQCRDWQRQAYRQRERQVALDQVLPTLSAKERSEEDDVRAILERLPQDDRSILALFYLEGFSVKELAFTLELSLSAVKTRLYRARGRFDELWRAEES